jgi:hypothetical protein
MLFETIGYALAVVVDKRGAAAFADANPPFAGGEGFTSPYVFEVAVVGSEKRNAALFAEIGHGYLPARQRRRVEAGTSK